jgi:hypothetical protein
MEKLYRSSKRCYNNNTHDPYHQIFRVIHMDDRMSALKLISSVKLLGAAAEAALFPP